MTIAANNVTAYGFETPGGPATAGNELLGGTGATAAGHLETCFVACGWTGGYTATTGWVLGITTIASAIASAKRDGGVIQVWDVAAAAYFALEGATTGVKTIPGPVTFAGPTTAGANTAGASGLLYKDDLLTEHASAALGPFQTPTVFVVTFSSQYAG